MFDLMYLIFHLVSLDSACHRQGFFQVCQLLSLQQSIFLYWASVDRCQVLLGSEQWGWGEDQGKRPWIRKYLTTF